MKDERVEYIWRNIMDNCERTGYATITNHVARELYEASNAGVDVPKLRDRIGALEDMLSAAHRKIERLEQEAIDHAPTE